MVKITTDALRTAEYFGMLARTQPAAVGAVVARGSSQLQGMIKSLAPVDTGRYRNSIRVEGVSPSPFHYSAEIGSDLDYGDDLEFGTEDTDPKPHFRPAMATFEPIFVANIRAVLP